MTESGIDISAYLRGDEIEGVWFDFRDDCRIQLRYLSPLMLRTLKREATRKRFVGEQVVEDFDEELFNRKLSEEIICDWTGFFDEKGETVPCTPENRRLLMDNWTELNLFVQNVSVSLDDIHRNKAEGELKN